MVRMISAANVAPDFSQRRDLTASELRRLDDLCVVFEHEGRDSDMQPFYVFTVGGTLDGLPVGSVQGGCTVGGDTMVITGVDSLDAATEIAAVNLEDTVRALDAEAAAFLQSKAALERLNSVGFLEVINQSIKPDSDKSDQFVKDMEAIRPLRGDGIILAAGGVVAEEEKP